MKTMTLAVIATSVMATLLMLYRGEYGWAMGFMVNASILSMILHCASGEENAKLPETNCRKPF